MATQPADRESLLPVDNAKSDAAAGVSADDGDLSGDDGGDGHGGASAGAPEESPAAERVRLVATIFKAFVGSGVLFLSKAYANGGWAASLSIMVFMALITQLTIVRLVDCRTRVKGSYAAIGAAAAGPWAAVAVDAALVLSQAGFCCVYIAFIARNVLQLLNVGACDPEPRVGGGWLWALVLAQAPLFVPLSWIRSMRTLGWTSAAANALIVGGLLGIVAWAATAWAAASPVPGGFDVPAFNSQGFALFLGSAVYAYEGIGMGALARAAAAPPPRRRRAAADSRPSPARRRRAVVPVYDSLSARGQATFSWVLSATLAGVAGVYLVVGMVPYLYLVGAAHEAVGDAVTLSLPATWWAYGIMGAYCVALALTYPLMLFPVLRIAERAAAQPLGLRAGSALARTWKRNGLRSAVVASTLLIAYLGAPQLDNLVALVGCFACTPLAFIFPAWFHMRLAPRTLFTDATNGAIIVLGVAVFCFSTYEAIAGWAVVAINPCRGA